MNTNLTLVGLLDPVSVGQVVSVYSTMHKFIAKNVLKVFDVRNQLWGQKMKWKEMLDITVKQ